MNRFAVAALLLVLALTGLGQARAAAPAAVTFPDYAAERGLSLWATAEQYAEAVADPRFVMEKFAYPSGGLEVYAYVYRPKATGARMPVIVFNRGSYVRTEFAAELVVMARRLAQQGYLVVAPMYRGSGGAAGRDEMGGADVDDLMNLVPALKALGYADMDRVYLYGESRGGMMVYQALRDGFPARAAAVYGAFTDLGALLESERWAQVGAQIWPDLAANREAIVERRSALSWAERINTPVLIMHGSRDESIDLDQAQRMAARLKELGKPSELVVFEGENHVITGRAADRDRAAMTWFETH